MVSNSSIFINIEQEMAFAHRNLKSFLKDLLTALDTSKSLSTRVLALGSALNSLPTPLKVATIGFAAAGAAIHSTLKYASEGKEMAGLVRDSGLAADKFQALANASKHYGGSAQATAQSLSRLRTGLADIQKGGNGNGLADTLKDFNILPEGIKSTDHFLTVIATRMGELKSETEKMDFGRALGLDDLIKNTKQQVCCLVRDFNSILNSFLIDCLFVKNFYNSISIRI